MFNISKWVVKKLLQMQIGEKMKNGMKLAVAMQAKSNFISASSRNKAS
jgi:hypothetical protein